MEVWQFLDHTRATYARFKLNHTSRHGIVFRSQHYKLFIYRGSEVIQRAVETSKTVVEGVVRRPICCAGVMDAKGGTDYFTNSLGTHFSEHWFDKADGHEKTQYFMEPLQIFP